jgi:hypothetical protein
MWAFMSLAELTTFFYGFKMSDGKQCPAARQAENGIGGRTQRAWPGYTAQRWCQPTAEV